MKSRPRLATWGGVLFLFLFSHHHATIAMAQDEALEDVNHSESLENTEHDDERDPAQASMSGAKKSSRKKTGPSATSRRSKSAPSGRPAVAAQRMISDVKVKGNKRLEAAAILEKMALKKGVLMDPSKVRADVQSIFDLGVFDQIEIFESDVGGGVELIVSVIERPVIGKITYQGLDNLKQDDLKEAVLIKRYNVFNPALASESMTKIRQVYEGKGYYLAEATYETKEIPGAQNEVELIIKIAENDKIRIKKINFLGNKVFPDSDLKGIMKTREGGALSFLTESGSFREVDLERDLVGLNYWYYDHGFVQVQIGKPQISISPDKRWVYITITISEGDQFNIGEVRFDGDLLFSEDDLRQDLILEKGETFSSTRLRDQTLKYTAKYGDLGYAFANVVPQHAIRPEEKLVDITFAVEKGEKVTLGLISMLGNSKTRDKVIRRELLMKEGELYNETKLRKSRENVERLGFFEKGVAFNKVVRPGTKDILDINIVVKERNTGTLTVGAGYSSAEGFIANAQVSQENFLGYGHRMAFYGIYSKSASRFNLSYDDPYFWDTEWSLGGDIYRQDRSVVNSFGYLSYGELKFGGDIRLGHPIAEYVRIFGNYKLEDVNLSSEFNKNVITSKDNEGLTSSVTAQVVRDSRDNRFEPSSGSYQSASVEVAGLGGDKFFTKVDLDLRWFHTLFWKMVLRTNLQYGYGVPIGGHNYPVNERYVLGGPYSLRGYQPLTVGSVVCAQGSILVKNASGADVPLSDLLQSRGIPQGICGGEGQGFYPWVLGGRQKIMGTVEVEFPIFEQVGIKGAVFVDAGQAFDGLNIPDNKQDPQKAFTYGPGILSNWGFEVRWFSPIGPLRFIFGFPFVALPGEKKDMVFNFTIGPSF